MGGNPTGGKAVTKDLGIKLDNVRLEDLGRAKKLTITWTTLRSSRVPGKASEIDVRENFYDDFVGKCFEWKAETALRSRQP
jgi:hypothetical protein